MGPASTCRCTHAHPNSIPTAAACPCCLLQVLEAAIQKMVQDAKTKALAKAAAVQPFIPAPGFQGRKRGYVFTTRSSGTG